MSPEAKAPSQDEQADQERLAAEWANVGLCGGMYRLAGREQPEERRDHEAERSARPHVNEAEWQPNQRCCG